MQYKTHRMQAVEAEYGQPIEALLRQWHHTQRLTLREIAQRCGVSTQSISRWMVACRIPVRHVSPSERPAVND